MGYYNTANVLRINSFSQAANKFKNTKPIRGKPDMVPLGDRRYYGMARMAMPSEDQVELLFYGKPLVIWRSDNTFTVCAPTYQSAYIPDNATPMLPFDLAFRWVDCQMFLKVDDDLIRANHGAVLNFEFDPKTKKPVLLNPPMTMHVRVRRAALNSVMESYRPFLDWARVVLSNPFVSQFDDIEGARNALCEHAGIPTFVQLQKYREEKGADYSQADWRRQSMVSNMPYAFNRGGKNGSLCKEIAEAFGRIMRGDDANEWTKVVRASTSVAGRVLRYGQPYHSGSSVGFAMTINHKEFETVALDVIKYLHRNEVFERVPVKKGEVCTRTNQKYFREVSFFSPE